MNFIDDLLSQASTLVKRGYPESTARKIASGELPMDEASRMARADDQGYLTDAYHASKQDILDFQPGYSDNLGFTTPEQSFANNWLGKGKMRFRKGAEDETEEDLEKLCKKASKSTSKWPVIVSVAINSFLIQSYAKEDAAFWAPAPLLEELVASGKTFDDLNKAG